MHKNTVMQESALPILKAEKLSLHYGRLVACKDVNLTLWPGEVLGIVGESGSGKSTLLRCLSAQLRPTVGKIFYHRENEDLSDIYALREMERRLLMRTDWGFVFQSPAEGLRMKVSAGGNVAERLAAVGCRRYHEMRNSTEGWLEQVEIDVGRINDRPDTYSGGMQQRLQIARNLVSHPKLVFMDEPTGGLDVSVQARLIDLLQHLVIKLKLSVIVVTHDLAVVRHLSHRLLVMRDGRIVEEGLTDQVLDDPQHPYTQLLVSSILSH